MLMRHVSLHDTVDTPSHTPAHTRLLEHIPLYNRLWAIAFNQGTEDLYFHFRLLSGHCHREASPLAKQLPRTPPDFSQWLLDITRTVWETTRADDCDTRDIISIQDEFDYDHHHQVQWHELYTMENRDCTTSRAEASVRHHPRILQKSEDSAAN
jgi:hypothetical protein